MLRSQDSSLSYHRKRFQNSWGIQDYIDSITGSQVFVVTHIIILIEMYKSQGQKKEKIPQKDKNSINPHPFAILVPTHKTSALICIGYYANTRIGVPAVLSPIIKNKKVS